MVLGWLEEDRFACSCFEQGLLYRSELYSPIPNHDSFPLFLVVVSNAIPSKNVSDPFLLCHSCDWPIVLLTAVASVPLLV